MNRAQRKAWFTVIGFMLNVMIGGVLTAVLPTNDPANVKFLGLGIYQIQAYGLWLAAFLVWIVLADFFFRKKPNEVFDERDQQICQRSTAIATTVFWIAFGVACATLVLIFGPLKISFPAIWVIGPLIVGGLVIFNSAYSIAALVQYGRTGDGEQP